MTSSDHEFTQALADARRRGELPAVVDLLFRQAMSRHDDGDDAAAIRILREAVSVADALPPVQAKLLPQIALAHLLRQQETWDEAHRLYQDALRRARTLDIDPVERDLALGQIFLGLGRIFEVRAQTPAAVEAWRRSLGFFRRGGHREWTALVEQLLAASRP